VTVPEDDWLEEVRRVAAFRMAMRRFERTTERAARFAGITPRQHLLLLAVVGMAEEGKGASVSELAEHLQIAQSTATGLVDRAVAAGLVERTSARADARFVYVVPTPRGLAALRTVVRRLDAEREALVAAAEELRAQLAPSRRGRGSAPRAPTAAGVARPCQRRRSGTRPDRLRVAAARRRAQRSRR
jgi:DNA-binding MarR family transcriptional regulator